MPWDEGPEIRDALFDGRGYLPVIGLIILEIQERLLRILVRCVELLLPDIDLTIDGLQLSGPSFSSPPMLRTDGADVGSPEWRSLMETNAKAAYELPRTFDLEQFLKVVTAKRDEAQDNIWALREDPSYFREVLRRKRPCFEKPTTKSIKQPR